MDWNFNLGWFFAGLAIIAAGAAIIYFYKPIADNFAHGINSYGRIKFAGIIIILIGFLVTTNLHTLILNALVNLIFHHQSLS